MNDLLNFNMNPQNVYEYMNQTDGLIIQVNHIVIYQSDRWLYKPDDYIWHHWLCYCYRKKQERLKKQQEHNTPNHKSQSATDVSSIASSSRSSRSPWKDPTLDARPIADPALRKKLQSARGTRVTPRVSTQCLLNYPTLLINSNWTFLALNLHHIGRL